MEIYKECYFYSKNGVVDESLKVVSEESDKEFTFNNSGSGVVWYDARVIRDMKGNIRYIEVESTVLRDYRDKDKYYYKFYPAEKGKEIKNEIN